MRRTLISTMVAATMSIAGPALAQDAPKDANGEESAAKLDRFSGMMAGLFQTDPLTAEQEARLPAATAVVGTMMPEGFYGEMMADMMDKMIRPMMSMFTAPEFVLGSRLDIEQEAIEALDEGEQAELMAMLDPAYDRRVDAIVTVLTANMGDMYAAMEGPMRDGLSKAYAVRFDERQLADIAAFFATPTGSVYARESMALFADPQVIQASMEAVPAMMGSFGDFESSMVEAMATLPAERAYADLSRSERARMAQLLGVQPAALGKIVKPPSPMDGSGDESGM
ncbi:DUF2059 domain-containing protein [Erythrobacter sp. AP23]|uniref:DUF2059 domain-containing protein n=1 Tax=Erythrobacter sp. AP23 TaxID=499656 RepID=UPI00076D7AEC|nr:DUF2059 domain-containing protein [Erythrobacter sp. AP23]KWV94752.1 hypothetical protein ASS64_05920 [Erythrobacter sp. AP23]